MWTRRRKHIAYLATVFTLSLLLTLGEFVAPWTIFVTGLPTRLGYSLFGWFDARESLLLYSLFCLVMIFACMLALTLPTLAALHFRRREMPFGLLVQLAALILYYGATFEAVFKNV